MPYLQGQLASVKTTVRDETGSPIDATVVLTVTAPDGTVTTPTVSHPGTGEYTADLPLSQAGDWLLVWSTSGTVTTVDSDQIHVIAPGLRAVSLTEVKEHGNITGTAPDRELLDFIGTAQQMVEAVVGATTPRTVVGERLQQRRGETCTWLAHSPVLEVTKVVVNGVELTAGVDYLFWPDTGQLDRLLGGTWWGSDVLVDYRAGRNPVPDSIRWAVKELTIHLWRSTQAQRGGRGRGEAVETAAAFGLPNRVRDALVPYTTAVLVA